MKIELKKIAYNSRLSQETAAYAADVYVNGVKRGFVENSGRGGCDNVFPHELKKEIEEYGKTVEGMPEISIKVGECSDYIFGRLLDDHLIGKDLKSKMKKKTLYLGVDNKVYASATAPANAVKVLNTMPIEDAVACYKQYVK
jgi:hypothetical protein